MKGDGLRDGRTEKCFIPFNRMMISALRICVMPGSMDVRTIEKMKRERGGSCYAKIGGGRREEDRNKGSCKLEDINPLGVKGG